MTQLSSKSVLKNINIQFLCHFLEKHIKKINSSTEYNELCKNNTDIDHTLEGRFLADCT